VTLSIERPAGTGPGGPSAATRLAVEIQPQRALTTGMVMTPLAVKAVQDDSPAAAAGVVPGDILKAVDGEPIGDPLTLDERLRERVGRPARLTLERSGQTLTIDVEPRPVTWIEEPRWPSSPVAVSSLGVALGVDALVADVAADGPAAGAGIRPGDRVVRVRFVDPARTESGPQAADQGLELSSKSPSWPYVVSVLQQTAAGTRLLLTVEAADGGRRDVEIEPVAARDQSVVDRGLIFEPVYTLVRAGSFLGALRRGASKAVEDLSMVYRFLHKLTSNQISPRLLGGPIEIAKQAGKSAEEGFSRLLLFLTMLSANLAVVNFLPIPVLDGGHMVFLLYEWIRGKPPSEGVVGVLSYLGLALILTLMMFVFGLDLGLIPRR
jgi:regulator of sigma E protease